MRSSFALADSPALATCVLSAPGLHPTAAQAAASQPGPAVAPPAVPARRAITVAGTSAVRVHEGAGHIHMLGGWSTDGDLQVGDEVVVTNQVAQGRGLGRYANRITGVTVRRGHHDVTAEYDITMVDGVLEVTRG
ncbi:MAG: hypothetical protein LBR19_03185 [Bifidobacteriaceae bacterium]|jgi:hypothetical protein|nr:hypothetical protein [Bifidobacteriaceae bacterium]